MSYCLNELQLLWVLCIWIIPMILGWTIIFTGKYKDKNLEEWNKGWNGGWIGFFLFLIPLANILFLYMVCENWKEEYWD